MNQNSSPSISAVVAEFEPPLLRYATRVLGDAHAARDVVQEVFLRLCDQESAALNGKLPRWLYTVCRNCAIDVRRKSRRVPLGSGVGEESAIEAAIDGSASPARSLEKSEARSKALELLDQLPEDQRECISLRLHADLGYKEVAALTGYSVTNVGFLIHVGLKAIREKMATAE